MTSADETYEGKSDATFRGGSMVAQMDPVVFVSAMAAVTKSVSFGITGSTSYIKVTYSSLHTKECSDIDISPSCLQEPGQLWTM